MNNKQRFTIKKRDRRFLYNSFIICCLLSFIFLLFLKLILKNKASEDIATTISGTLGIALGFFGSVLIYLALVSQIDANKQIKLQFEKQNQDQLFFKLFDSLHNRIVNYTILNPHTHNSEIKGYEILTFFVRKFQEDMYTRCAYLGRHLLAKKPEIIAENHYINILNSKGQMPLEEAMELKDKLINIGNYNNRWEFIKSYINSAGHEDAYQHQVLTGIGSVYFYKIDFEDRYDIYHGVYDQNYKAYGGFFDGYFNNLIYILKFIEKSTEEEFYIDFLKSNITAYEKAFIYYYLASNSASRNTKDLIKKYNLIEDLIDYNGFFVDIPNSEEFQKEIENFYYSEQIRFT